MRAGGMMIAIAACSGIASGAACSQAPQHVRGDEGTPLQRDTPAPKLAWHGEKFDVTGLPAIARGGEIVVVSASDADGERGWPNLRLDVRDRLDKVLKTIPVMTSAEFETLVKEGVPSAELQRRVAAANTELARLHGLHDLVLMHPLELQPVEGADSHLAMGDGVDVDWNQDHLHVFSHNANHPLVTRDGHGWLAREAKSCPDCEPCNNPPFLRAVYHTAGINAVVVDISYHGTDSCNEPADQQHVVVW